MRVVSNWVDKNKDSYDVDCLLFTFKDNTLTTVSIRDITDESLVVHCDSVPPKGIAIGDEIDVNPIEHCEIHNSQYDIMGRCITVYVKKIIILVDCIRLDLRLRKPLMYEH